MGKKDKKFKLKDEALEKVNGGSDFFSGLWGKIKSVGRVAAVRAVTSDNNGKNENNQNNVQAP